MTPRIIPHRVCIVDECNNRRHGQGYCNKHYARVRKGGHVDYLRCIKGIGETQEERFWSKADKTPGYGPNGDCWQWKAGHSQKGYGAMRWNNVPMRAHKIAWIIANGRMPTLCILHSCDNRACVNPAHLREGTNADNVADKMSRGRQAKGPALGAAVSRGRRKSNGTAPPNKQTGAPQQTQAA